MTTPPTPAAPVMKDTIQVRTDAAVKIKATQLLHALGMDMSTAINLYLKQIVMTKSIPFEIRLSRPL